METRPVGFYVILAFRDHERVDGSVLKEDVFWSRYSLWESGNSLMAYPFKNEKIAEARVKTLRRRFNLQKNPRIHHIRAVHLPMYIVIPEKKNESSNRPH